jgi:hypothetical protein
MDNKQCFHNQYLHTRLLRAMEIKVKGSDGLA